MAGDGVEYDSQRSEVACRRTSSTEDADAVVPLSALKLGLSPRSTGEDEAHVRRLLEVVDQLPPITVHRETMKIIDGAHRWRAAVARGNDTIAVRYFSGTDEDAFLLGIELNLAHGLPLSLDDRKSAADKVLSRHPEWSDRRIAEAVGLSPKTVAARRRHSNLASEENPQLTPRLGRDNRWRSATARLGIGSEAKRVPSENEAFDTASNASFDGAASQPLRIERLARPHSSVDIPVQPSTVMAALRRDPSVCLSRSGRQLLVLLGVNELATPQWQHMAAAVPSHRREAVADLADRYAKQWQGLAAFLRGPERRNGARSERSKSAVEGDPRRGFVVETASSASVPSRRASG